MTAPATLPARTISFDLVARDGGTVGADGSTVGDVTYQLAIGYLLTLTQPAADRVTQTAYEALDNTGYRTLAALKAAVRTHFAWVNPLATPEAPAMTTETTPAITTNGDAARETIFAEIATTYAEALALDAKADRARSYERRIDLRSQASACRNAARDLGDQLAAHDLANPPASDPLAAGQTRTFSAGPNARTPLVRYGTSEDHGTTTLEVTHERSGSLRYQYVLTTGGIGKGQRIGGRVATWGQIELLIAEWSMVETTPTPIAVPETQDTEPTDSLTDTLAWHLAEGRDLPESLASVGVPALIATVGRAARAAEREREETAFAALLTAPTMPYDPDAIDALCDELEATERAVATRARIASLRACSPDPWNNPIDNANQIEADRLEWDLDHPAEATVHALYLASLHTHGDPPPTEGEWLDATGLTLPQHLDPNEYDDDDGHASPIDTDQDDAAMVYHLDRTDAHAMQEAR